MDSLKDLQKAIADFTEENNLVCSPQSRLLDLLSELGEVSKELLKGSDYGRGELVLPVGWHEEIGDLLFSLICLANESGVDLKDALDCVMEKYKRRLEKGGVGSGR